MAKRFTDNGIWKKGWFMKLPAHIKLFWQYLRDDCDSAGVWEPNFDVASLFVGQEVTEKDLHYFGDRIEKIENGKYWLTGFIEFQYNNNLSEKSPAHKPIFSSINKNKIHNRVFNRLSNRVSDTLQEKDKEKETDKDKEQEKDKEKGGVDFEKIGIAPEMVIAFKSKFPNYPKDQKKDFTACLEIAYKIGEASGFTKNEVTGIKKSEVLQYWQQILEYVAKDKWFSTRALYDLNNEWQRLIQTINNGTRNFNNSKASARPTTEQLNQAADEHFNWQ